MDVPYPTPPVLPPQDPDDPCVILKELKAAKRNIAMGKATQRIRFTGSTGAEREVEYHKLDPNALGALIREYEIKCAEKEGRCSPYHAFRAG